MSQPTEDLLLVASEVNGLRTTGLLHERRGDGLLGRLKARPAGRVDSLDKGALLDAWRARLPQREAQRSAGSLCGHCSEMEERRGEDERLVDWVILSRQWVSLE